MKSVDLVEYISEALRDGRSFRSIIFELVNAGWNNVDIQEAMAEVQNARSATSQVVVLPKEVVKPLVTFRGPIANPLPSLVEETRPLTLQKKYTQGAIPASRIFTSFLQKEMEKQSIPKVESQPTLSDIPMVEIMSSQPVESPKEPEVRIIEEVKKEVVEDSTLEPPLPPEEKHEAEESVTPIEEPFESPVVVVPSEPEKAVFQSPALRPDGYFIPTLGYLADEAVVGKQNVQILAEQIGKPTFIIPTKVIITAWKRDEPVN